MEKLLNSDKIWYVCYGSNLLTERFLCYLNGGTVPFDGGTEIGSLDKNFSGISEPFILPFQLSFRFSVPKWNGSGVAFLDTICLNNVKTYGKRYLVSVRQFLDIVKQENSTDKEPVINEKELLTQGSTIVYPDTFYGKILYLGKIEDVPLLTFTSVIPVNKLPAGYLSNGYYDVIFAGIKETYGFSDEEIKEYLKQFTK